MCPIKTDRMRKGRSPSCWIGSDPQPRSGSGDLSEGSMAKIIKFIVARTYKWLGLSRPTRILRHPCVANSHNPNQINKIGFCFLVIVS